MRKRKDLLKKRKKNVDKDALNNEVRSLYEEVYANSVRKKILESMIP